jgi:hypothetical protein
MSAQPQMTHGSRLAFMTLDYHQHEDNLDPPLTINITFPHNLNMKAGLKSRFTADFDATAGFAG